MQKCLSLPCPAGNNKEMRAPFSCFKYSVPTNGVFYNGESLLPVDTGHQTQFELRRLWDRTNKLFKKNKKGSHAQNLARRKQQLEVVSTSLARGRQEQAWVPNPQRFL